MVTLKSKKFNAKIYLIFKKIMEIPASMLKLIQETCGFTQRAQRLKPTV
jgi:hypothetical protein